jgi:site-specific DNA-methyltransferase (adenine-specific)
MIIEKSNAIDFLKKIPDGIIDCVVTDPPYDTLDKHRAIGTNKRCVRWFETLKPIEIVSVVAECYRILKNPSHCYMMCNSESAWEFHTLLNEKTKFTVHKSIIWDKVCIGMGYNYRSLHEHILFLKKGKRKLNDLGIGDVLRFKRIHSGQAPYPTSKPVGLLQTLILQSTNEDETVLDPFCGGGSTGVATEWLGREFIGCDTSEEAIEISKKRCNQAIISRKKLLNVPC